jgi:hypothetical protein
MFEWLVEEMTKIKTRKFHLVDGPASPEFREAVVNTGFPLPPSYKEFVLQFGNAKLYRRSSYWLVEVYAGPREVVSGDGEALIQFGRTHTSLSYFKESQLEEGRESPVFEWRHQQGVQQTAESFQDWLTAKCRWARKQYKKKEREAIEHGPPPFTERELALVESRRQFRWRVVGIAPNGDLRFEVHNGSHTILTSLSVGVRGKLRPPKTGPLDGGVYLPVSSIRPGETKIVEHDCYKQFVLPEDAEVFELPDPEPEDREQYWEFKPIPT